MILVLFRVSHMQSDLPAKKHHILNVTRFMHEATDYHNGISYLEV